MEKWRKKKKRKTDLVVSDRVQSSWNFWFRPLVLVSSSFAGRHFVCVCWFVGLLVLCFFCEFFFSSFFFFSVLGVGTVRMTGRPAHRNSETAAEHAEFLFPDDLTGTTARISLSLSLSLSLSFISTSVCVSVCVCVCECRFGRFGRRRRRLSSVSFSCFFLAFGHFDFFFREFFFCFGGVFRPQFLVRRAAADGRGPRFFSLFYYYFFWGGFAVDFCSAFFLAIIKIGSAMDSGVILMFGPGRTGSRYRVLFFLEKKTNEWILEHPTDSRSNVTSQSSSDLSGAAIQAGPIEYKKKETIGRSKNAGSNSTAKRKKTNRQPKKKNRQQQRLRLGAKENSRDWRRNRWTRRRRFIFRSISIRRGGAGWPTPDDTAVALRRGRNRRRHRLVCRCRALDVAEIAPPNTPTPTHTHTHTHPHAALRLPACCPWTATLQRLAVECQADLLPLVHPSLGRTLDQSPPPSSGAHHSKTTAPRVVTWTQPTWVQLDSTPQSPPPSSGAHRSKMMPPRLVTETQPTWAQLDSTPKHTHTTKEIHCNSLRTVWRHEAEDQGPTWLLHEIRAHTHTHTHTHTHETSAFLANYRSLN